MNITTNKIRVFALVAIAAATVFVGSVSAQSIAELEAQIKALQSQLGGSSTTTSVVGSFNFARNLTVGSVGEDVRQLQVLLNSNPATQVASSGAGSPGNEGTRFGPATRAAVQKFQRLYGISATGSFGPQTRAKANSLGGVATTTPPTNNNIVTPIVTSGDLTVSAGRQPADGYAIKGAQRVPYTTFNVTAGRNSVTVNSIVVEKSGLSSIDNFDSVSIVDAQGSQVGNSTTFNSTGVATVSARFTVGAGQTIPLTVVASVNKCRSASDTGCSATSTLLTTGAVAGLKVTGVNTSGGRVLANVSGANHVFSDAVALGSIVVNSTDRTVGNKDTSEIAELGVRKQLSAFTIRSVSSTDASNNEGATVRSITFVQAGSADASEIQNLKVRIDGVDYTPSVNGDRITVSTPQGIAIEKNRTINVDVFGSVNVSNRTVQLTVDDASDVYIVGSTYGYGLPVTLQQSNSVVTRSYSQKYDIRGAKISSGSALYLSSDDKKPVLGPNQIIGAGEKFVIAGESISFKGTTITLAVNPAASSSKCPTDGDFRLSNIRLVTSKNGNTVDTANDIIIRCTLSGSPQVASYALSVNSTVSGTLTSATGAGSIAVNFKNAFELDPGEYGWFVYADIEQDWNNGATISLSAMSSWTKAQGTVSRTDYGSESRFRTVASNGQFEIQGNVVKFALTDNGVDTTSFVKGQDNITFGSISIDASKAQKDVTLRNLNLKVTATSSSTLNGLDNCRIVDGTQTVGSLSSDPVGGAASSTDLRFEFNDYIIPAKSAVKYYPIRCRFSNDSAESGTGTYTFSVLGNNVTYKVGSDQYDDALTARTGRPISVVTGGTFKNQIVSRAVSGVDARAVGVGRSSTEEYYPTQKVRFTADRESLNIRRILVKVTSDSASATADTSAIASIRISDGSNTTVKEASDTSALGTFAFDSSLGTVEAGQSKEYTVSVRFNGTALTSTAKSTVYAKITTIEADGSVSGVIPSLTVAAASDSTGYVVYRNAPTVTVTSRNVNAYGSTGSVVNSVTIAAPASKGDLRIGKISFQVSNVPSTGVTLRNAELKVGSTTLASQATVTPSSGSATLTFDISLKDEAIITAGSSKTFDLALDVATTGSITGNSSFSTQFLKDALADTNFAFDADATDGGISTYTAEGNAYGLVGLDDTVPSWSIRNY
ncbi:MAG: peptidoglycan-binding domain-containing protein [Alphaproteobacteria bacterium]|nr:peptidoglycan-binding domain-containing protein [Alphaproteobacteria bacterium]